MKNQLIPALMAACCVTLSVHAQGVTAESNDTSTSSRLDVKTPRYTETINGELDERSARVANQTPPYYPAALRKAGIKGDVVVEVVVDRNNTMMQPRIVQSAHPELDQLALEAVLGWDYEAAVVNGQMAQSRLQVTVTFDPAAPTTDKKSKLAKTRGKPDKKLPPEYQFDEEPVAVRTVKPVYPYELLRKSKTGRATVTFVVDPRGNARAAEVKSASAPEFGLATAAMVEAWEFEPATKDGQPCWALLTKEQVFNQINRDSPVDQPTKDLLDELERGTVKLYTVEEVDNAPKTSYRINPDIPDGVVQAGVPVRAEIEFIIDHGGRVRLPRIVSATRDDFGWSATTAVSRWLFEPALKDGQPVYLKVKLPFVYNPPKKG
jgi:TonB family protein